MFRDGLYGFISGLLMAGGGAGINMVANGKYMQSLQTREGRQQALMDTYRVAMESAQEYGSDSPQAQSAMQSLAGLYQYCAEMELRAEEESAVRGGQGHSGHYQQNRGCEEGEEGGD